MTVILDPDKVPAVPLSERPSEVPVPMTQEQVFDMLGERFTEQEFADVMQHLVFPATSLAINEWARAHLTRVEEEIRRLGMPVGWDERKHGYAEGLGRAVALLTLPN